MRFLLTSNGLTNDTIREALNSLLDASAAKTNVAFIPTAANAESGDKGWLIDDLRRFRSLGFAQLDIVDISALPHDVFMPRLEAADVIVIGGGNTPHLLSWLRRTELARNRSLFADRVYVGISAGSIAAGASLNGELSRNLYCEESTECMELVDVSFLPHFNSPVFPLATEANIRAWSLGVTNVYAVDDESALLIRDDVITICSEGSVAKI